MNGIFSYLKSYVILFLVLTILLEMVPKAGMQKYIRFFSQMILVFGLLYPVLGWMGESDAFLKKLNISLFYRRWRRSSQMQKKSLIWTMITM